MSRRPPSPAGDIAAMAASLAADIGRSRWRRLMHIETGERTASPPQEEAAAAPPAPALPASPWSSLDEISGLVRACTNCPLHEGRTNAVPGEGNPDADLMFIGEGPGGDEDRLGRPFVGRAGQLLDRIIAAMGLAREEVFIANVVKCRPPGNRNPEPPEMAACLPYLYGQIELIRPKVIVALGKFSAQSLLDSKKAISQLRGHFADYRGIRLMPTFHPSYLLRNPEGKKLVWEDMQQVMAVLGLKRPERQG